METPTQMTFLNTERSLANVGGGAAVALLVNILGVPVILPAVIWLGYKAQDASAPAWVDKILDGAEYGIGYYGVNLLFQNYAGLQ